MMNPAGQKHIERVEMETLLSWASVVLVGLFVVIAVKGFLKSKKK